MKLCADAQMWNFVNVVCNMCENFEPCEDVEMLGQCVEHMEIVKMWKHVEIEKCEHVSTWLQESAPL